MELISEEWTEEERWTEQQSSLPLPVEKRLGGLRQVPVWEEEGSTEGSSHPSSSLDDFYDTDLLDLVTDLEEDLVVGMEGIASRGTPHRERRVERREVRRATKLTWTTTVMEDDFESLIDTLSD